MGWSGRQHCKKMNRVYRTLKKNWKLGSIETKIIVFNSAIKIDPRKIKSLKNEMTTKKIFEEFVDANANREKCRMLRT